MILKLDRSTLGHLDEVCFLVLVGLIRWDLKWNTETLLRKDQCGRAFKGSHKKNHKRGKCKKKWGVSEELECSQLKM